MSATVLTAVVPSSDDLIVLPARVVSRIDLAVKLFLWSRRCLSSLTTRFRLPPVMRFFSLNQSR